MRFLDAGGQFQDSGQVLGGDTPYELTLGDLDGAGDPDAFVANSIGNRLWINQGGKAGVLVDGDQNLSVNSSTYVKLVETGSDGDLDAIVAKFTVLPMGVWISNGNG